MYKIRFPRMHTVGIYSYCSKLKEYQFTIFVVNYGGSGLLRASSKMLTHFVVNNYGLIQYKHTCLLTGELQLGYKKV